MMKQEIDMSKIMELKLAYLETEVRRDLSTVLYEYSAFVDDVTLADKKPFTSYEFKCMLERIERFREESTIDIKDTKADEPELGKITATAFPSGGITNGLFFGSYEEKTLREILNKTLNDDISNFYKFKSSSSSFISILNSIQDFQNASLEDYAKLNCTTEITKTMLPLDNVNAIYRIENYLREDDAIFINQKIRNANKNLHDDVMRALIRHFNNSTNGETFKIENGIQPYGSQLDVPKLRLEKMQAGEGIEISLVENPKKVILQEKLDSWKEKIDSHLEKINAYFDFFAWLKTYLQNIQEEYKAGLDIDAAVALWKQSGISDSVKEERAKKVKELLNHLLSVEVSMSDPEVKENAVKIQTIYKYSSCDPTDPLDISPVANDELKESSDDETKIIVSRHKRIVDEVRRDLSNDIIDVKCIGDGTSDTILSKTANKEFDIYCNKAAAQTPILQLQLYKTMMKGIKYILTTTTATSLDVYQELMNRYLEVIPELHYRKGSDGITYLNHYFNAYTALFYLLERAVDDQATNVEDAFKNNLIEEAKKLITDMHDTLITIVTEVMSEREHTLEDIYYFLDQMDNLGYVFGIDEDRAVLYIYKEDSQTSQP